MRNNLNLYTLQERIFLVKTFYKNDCNVKDVKSHYLLEYGELFDDVPTDSIIFEVISLFEETGNIREIPEDSSASSFKIEEQDAPDHFVGNIWTDIKLENTEIKTESLDSELQPPQEVYIESYDVNFEADEKKPIQKRSRLVKSGKTLKESTSTENKLSHSDDTDKDILQEVTKKHSKKPHSSIDSNTSKPKRIRIRKRLPKKDGGDYTCDICQKKFKSKAGMVSHIVRHSKKEELKVIKCKYCQENIVKAEMKRHIEQNHEDDIKREKEANRQTCPVCSKSLSDKSTLRKHLKSHSEEKNIVCDVCGKAFKHRHTLTMHMRLHTGECPYKCDVPNCNKAFRSANSYAFHKRCHTDEKPFPCHYCGKFFRDTGTRRVHYRQHTGEHPYKCELCGKETKQKQNLKSHMIHFHKMHQNIE